MSAGSGHKTNKSSSRLKSRTMQVFTCKHEVFALSVTIVSPVKPYSALLVTPHCAEKICAEKTLRACVQVLHHQKVWDRDRGWGHL